MTKINLEAHIYAHRSHIIIKKTNMYVLTTQYLGKILKKNVGHLAFLFIETWLKLLNYNDKKNIRLEC